MSSPMKNVMRWLPGALISVGLIAAILFFVDFRTMGAALRGANYWLLGAALVISFAWLGVRALVWWTMLRQRAPFKEVFFSLAEGYLMNNFLPFRLGELGRAFLLSRKSELQFIEILPTIVIERAVDLGYSAAILLLALPFVVGGEGSQRIAFLIGGLVILGLITLYLLARNRTRALEIFHQLSRRWPAIQRLGGSFLESFFEGLAVLNSGWLFARFLFWMTVNWGMASIMYFLIIRAFFPQAQFAWGMFGLGAAAFGGAIPSLPGAVGTFEGALGGALLLLSGDQSTAFTVALVTRLYNYLASGILGLIGLAREGQTLSGIYRQLINFRSREKKVESDQA